MTPELMYLVWSVALTFVLVLIAVSVRHPCIWTP